MLSRIFIVDDCEDITSTLTDYLHHVGYYVDAEHSRTGARKKLQSDKFDICLLDLDLPDNQGFDFLLELNRDYQEMPVIVVTGRESEDEKVMGLELGAEDYVAKPIQLRELQARIRVVLRRHKNTVQNQTPTPQNAQKTFINYDFFGYEFDLIKRKILSNDEAIISLTEYEALTLKLLLDAEECPVSREDILHHKDPAIVNFSFRSVDITITRLRQKLSSIFENNIIETVYGKGYRIKKNNQKMYEKA